MRAAALLVLALLGCGSADREAPLEAPYHPDRRDYFAFAALHPGLIEPNYLPYMAHRLAIGDGPEEVLVLCRWSEERFPLAVYIERPRIPRSLQNEFDPRSPESYVEAVQSALALWERELEGKVRFRLVARRREADLRIVLRGEVAPAPDASISVLGTTPLRHACRIEGEGEATGTLVVDFEVSRMRLYLADDFGLLNPDQVERVAVHELGHVLGMRGHSPVPADVMYPVARDRLAVSGLSTQDVNSFLSLYAAPNGAIYRERPEEARRASPPRGLPQGSPRLALAPHVDVRFGYEFRPIQDWLRIETAQGMIAVNGVSWDYDASFQIVVQGYPTIATYLDRYGGHYVGAGRVVERKDLEIDGRHALRLVVEGRIGSLVEELTFIETGDGRVVVVIADCPAETYAAYRPWFEAALGTLEIRNFAPLRVPISP